MVYLNHLGNSSNIQQLWIYQTNLQCILLNYNNNVYTLKTKLVLTLIISLCHENSTDRCSYLYTTEGTNYLYQSIILFLSPYAPISVSDHNVGLCRYG